MVCVVLYSVFGFLVSVLVGRFGLPSYVHTVATVTDGLTCLLSHLCLPSSSVCFCWLDNGLGSQKS